MQLSIHYTDHMVAEAGSYSPSAAKPAQVMASWAKLGLPIQVIEPSPVTLEHDAQMVSDILSCQINNGFSNRSSNVAESLPYTTGAMLSAARGALDNGYGAIAPCSGFHHAGYSFVGGFGTFNGLLRLSTGLREDRSGIRQGTRHVIPPNINSASNLPVGESE
ncbi:hypothetical protein [Pseudomonas sp. N040]|uniref:hypothetical protein n=1 Tax=Pseudomonas sp. N040 TaxID=2785325 RepID=UPI0018A2C1C8|nr:hypothetical protein [Pseudomonas sp. N040]MBF7728622.1 hypothetical protein [Pseudomonas sp. N040]MBW7012262.1 hypothetical protein [Pseudomonas sp. N040]